MKKVCVLTSVHSPFDVRIFHKEAKLLKDVGYDVVLVAQHTKKEVVNGIKIIPISKPKNRLSRIFFTGWSILIKAFKEKADVYHFHDPELLPIGVVLKLLTGKKIIYDVHEDYSASIKSKYWLPKYLRFFTDVTFNIIEFISLKFIDAVIYTTPLIGERYKKYNGKRLRIDNYPSLLNFGSNTRQGMFGKIVYIGGLSKIRGIIELIKAFKEVSIEYPEARLKIIGDCSPPEFLDELRTIIKKFTLGNNVKIEKSIPYKDVNKVLSEGYVGVIPYLPYPNHLVTLPNKLFEYMATAIPVIISDFPLYREIVETTHCGILVDSKNYNDIANAIKYLFASPSKAMEMGENGRHAFLNEYNWEKESQKLLKLYYELFK